MTEAEFKNFVLGTTEVFSRIQLSDVFNFLDKDSKGYLDTVQMKKLFRPEIGEGIKKDDKSAEPSKKGDATPQESVKQTPQKEEPKEESKKEEEKKPEDRRTSKFS